MISIIMPVYNKVGYIGASIESVLAQTHPDWELLIVDNNSTDDSIERARGYKDERLRFFSESKRGPSAARNAAMGHIRGEWVHFLDADDLFDPDHCAEQIEASKRAPEAALVASGWKQFSSDIKNYTLKTPAGIDAPKQVLMDSAIAFAPWAMNSGMVRMSVLTPEFYWPEALDRFLGEDVPFWFKLLSRYDVAFNHGFGAYYRAQTADGRNQFDNAVSFCEGIDAAMKMNIDFLDSIGTPASPGQCENLMRAYAGLYSLARRQQQLPLAREMLNHARKWLDEYTRRNPNPSLSMRFRKLLGLRLFLDLKQRFEPPRRAA